MTGSATTPPRWFQRLTNISDDEVAAALWSCACFFFIFCSYYIIRPLREEMGLAGGVRNLPWLFMVTLVAMLLATPLFGSLVNRFPRRIFIPLTYRIFMFNLLIFFVLLHLVPASADVTLGRVFYVWVSVFNLFAVSLFWAFMADGFEFPRSKRLFGFIAMGGSLGAICGAALTAGLVGIVGRVNLILPAILLLEAAVQCFRHLGRTFRFQTRPPQKYSGQEYDTGPESARLQDKLSSRPAGKSLDGVLSGISRTLRSPYLLAISAYLFLYSLSSTFLYFEQANIVAATITERTARAALFARIDLWVNILTLATQIMFTGRIIARLGVGPTLALLPLLTVVGFIALGLSPVLVVLVIFQVARRAGNYALIKPARETLFTIVWMDEKYKAKSFIDTFVYRGGDALGAALFDGLTRLGLGMAGIAFSAVPFALVWGIVAIYLGVQQGRLARARGHDTESAPPADHRAA